MLFNRSGRNQSGQALVPMVDLFAVLAIVFMIYSHDEINVTQLEVQEARKRLEAIDEAEEARLMRREILAKQAVKTLEQIKEEREKKAQVILTQFTEMLAAQQEQADMEYDDILARIELEHDEALKQEAISLEEEKQAKLEKTVAGLETDLENEKAELVQQQEKRLAEAKEEFEEVISNTERMLANTQDAVVEAKQEGRDALAKQEAELKRQRELELAKKEQELKAQAEREAARLEREKEAALARADRERQGDLAAQRAALEKEKAEALSEGLAPYVQAQQAKKEIIEELDENFKDVDPAAVEVDERTGKVKLHFQESYFARGSHRLSEEMKSFLRIMIPRYAKSIYGNEDAAAHVESLKISGMASPIYGGVYIDINDRSPETEKARRYNMELSNRRAKALYDFIFAEAEMGEYEFRDRLEADMSIAAMGFQNATPVKKELVGKPANCIEYDCKQEQATVLEFRLFFDE